MQPAATPDDVMAFWREAGPERWFDQDAGFDESCRLRFRAAHEAAAAGRLGGWETVPEHALALIILLDQMPRNMFRGTPRAWSTDAAAVAVADRAVANGYDLEIASDVRQFVYMPFMHAENLATQDRCAGLCAQFGDPNVSWYARHHRDIVARFGRFPHRNDILGRESTPAETAFLLADGFRG